MKKENIFSKLKILSILKFCLIGVVVNLVGVLILALVLKFTDLPTNAVSYINDGVKILSLFLIALFLKKSDSQNLLIRMIFAGIIYFVLTFIIFSVLSGKFTFNLSVLYDFLFVLISSLVISVILNLLTKKTVSV